MNASTRHLHHQHLRDAAAVPALDDGGERSRGSLARRHNKRHQPPNVDKSMAVLDALTDVNSDLARFLFVQQGRRRSNQMAKAAAGAGGGHYASRQDGRVSMTWFHGFRRSSNTTNNYDNHDTTTDEDHNMPSMNKFDASFYALALEPSEIRNERIIMLFEAYTIFGALFMASVWIIYEWGSPKGYGGQDTNEIVDRLFEFVLAMTICCNLCIAILGANWWVHSITASSSYEDFFIESIKPLAYLHKALLLTNLCVVTGMLLGIYMNLSPHWPETIITLVFALILFVSAIQTIHRHWWNTIPLEVYHWPLWMKLSLTSFWRGKGRKDLKHRAKLRAQVSKKRAYRERKKLDPTFDNTKGSSHSFPVGGVLRNAAIHMGMIDSDVSVYEARMKEDWLFDIKQLKNKDVDWLARYMPFGLAEEVHTLLLDEVS